MIFSTCVVVLRSKSPLLLQGQMKIRLGTLVTWHQMAFHTEWACMKLVLPAFPLPFLNPPFAFSHTITNLWNFHRFINRAGLSISTAGSFPSLCWNYGGRRGSFLLNRYQPPGLRIITWQWELAEKLMLDAKGSWLTSRQNVNVITSHCYPICMNKLKQYHADTSDE